MRDAMYLPFCLLTTIAKVIQPGGARQFATEGLLLKQHLIIHSRSRQRVPNLAPARIASHLATGQQHQKPSINPTQSTNPTPNHLPKGLGEHQWASGATGSSGIT
tara:strand:- start:40 stop:354 length:315 start_codon:yes stop_codon:yes gene_type:complete